MGSMAAKVGMICLATDQGLGYLARDFYKNGLIDYVYIHEHSSRPNHRNWYPRESVVSSTEELIDKCDTIFAIETFFDWKVVPQAREKGKKTVLMVMYECSTLPYVPDLILSPSLLDHDYYPDSTLVTVPVSATPRLRSRAEVFVHNAGNGGLGGRNGTRELLEAMQYVKSPIKLIVRSQIPLTNLPPKLVQSVEEDDRIEVRIGTFDDIWSEGDVFIFPEKFNGLSLPLQEAYAHGMLVMASDRHPMNKWLPKEPLIPVESYRKEKIAVPIEVAELSPVAIANQIDKFYNNDVSSLSKLGIAWGQQNSWQNLKGRYEELLSP
jgi:hypothetical protein